MNKRQRLFFHIGFWFFFYFAGDILLYIGDKNYQFDFKSILTPLWVSSLIFRLLVTYGILFVLNKYLRSKQYLNIFLGFLIVCLAYAGLRYGVEEVLYFRLFGFHNYSEESRYFSYYLVDNIQNVILFSFGAFFLKMIEDLFRNEKERNDLLTEKIAAEQAFLKNQLNPHFLFNTLNNIYSLTLNQSPKAPEAVLKLSELMRYMLYESNVDKVNLETEVKYLKNFIELQKFRYSGQTFIEFEVAGDLHSQKVAPLLLIAFVENAFKHGEVSEVDKPLKISLLVNQNNLNFTLTNHKKDQNKDEIGGVGLENVKRRLNLIYPNCHSLEIRDSANQYFCELNIIL
ncbi:MAG: sensor histidine kinase [Spirosomataceae bacterium]